MLINVDPKALEYACQCAGRSVHHFDRMGDDLPLRASIIAHARAIEQHETDIADLQAEYDEVCNLFEAFRQEVSDAVEDAVALIENEEPYNAVDLLSRFIIAKPDPLVEVMNEMGFGWSKTASEEFRAAIEKRGGKITWGEG